MKSTFEIDTSEPMHEPNHVLSFEEYQLIETCLVLFINERRREVVRRKHDRVDHLRDMSFRYEEERRKRIHDAVTDFEDQLTDLSHTQYGILKRLRNVTGPEKM